MGEEKEKEKDVSTDMVGKPETTKFGEFCQRRGINSNLIMLKITLFLMYGGNISIWFQFFFSFYVECARSQVRRQATPLNADNVPRFAFASVQLVSTLCWSDQRLTLDEYIPYTSNWPLFFRLELAFYRIKFKYPYHIYYYYASAETTDDDRMY